MLLMIIVLLIISISTITAIMVYVNNKKSSFLPTSQPPPYTSFPTTQPPYTSFPTTQPPYTSFPTTQPPYTSFPTTQPPSTTPDFGKYKIGVANMVPETDGLINSNNSLIPKVVKNNDYIYTFTKEDCGFIFITNMMCSKLYYYEYVFGIKKLILISTSKTTDSSVCGSIYISIKMNSIEYISSSPSNITETYVITPLIDSRISPEFINGTCYSEINTGFKINKGDCGFIILNTPSSSSHSKPYISMFEFLGTIPTINRIINTNYDDIIFFTFSIDNYLYIRSTETEVVKYYISLYDANNNFIEERKPLTTCPDNWTIQSPPEIFYTCLSNPQYTGPCNKQAGFKDTNEAYKLEWSDNCQVPWSRLSIITPNVTVASVNYYNAFATLKSENKLESVKFGTLSLSNVLDGRSNNVTRFVVFNSLLEKDTDSVIINTEPGTIISSDICTKITLTTSYNITWGITNFSSSGEIPNYIDFGKYKIGVANMIPETNGLIMSKSNINPTVIKNNDIIYTFKNEDCGFIFITNMECSKLYYYEYVFDIKKLILISTSTTTNNDCNSFFISIQTNSIVYRSPSSSEIIETCVITPLIDARISSKFATLTCNFEINTGFKINKGDCGFMIANTLLSSQKGMSYISMFEFVGDSPTINRIINTNTDNELQFYFTEDNYLSIKSTKSVLVKYYIRLYDSNNKFISSSPISPLNVCPDNWILESPPENYICYGQYYSGPCGNRTGFTDKDEADKLGWSNACGAPWSRQNPHVNVTVGSRYYNAFITVKQPNSPEKSLKFGILSLSDVTGITDNNVTRFVVFNSLLDKDTDLISINTEPGTIINSDICTQISVYTANNITWGITNFSSSGF